jgi:hypothetical protein
VQSEQADACGPSVVVTGFHKVTTDAATTMWRLSKEVQHERLKMSLVLWPRRLRRPTMRQRRASSRRRLRATNAAGRRRNIDGVSHESPTRRSSAATSYRLPAPRQQRQPGALRQCRGRLRLPVGSARCRTLAEPLAGHEYLTK